MSGKLSHTEACPKCRSLGNDNRGDNLAVYHDGGRHCFSCGYHRSGGAPHLFSSNSGLLNNGPKSSLPFDFTREVPTVGWKWLLQYGLPYSYWNEFVGYSPHYERLVLTVGTPIQFSIGRHIGTEKRPKWLSWGDCHRHCEIINESADGPIVIGEDLISAHKIGQQATAIPLFGTKIHPCHMYFLNSNNRSIILWLDKDQEGTVMKQASWLQMMTGKPVNVVITDKDPKELSNEEISKHI